MSTITGKTVVVTGGTGSFGQAFTRRALSMDLGSIRIYSRDEMKQHEMSRKLDDGRVRYLIGDVRDERRLQRAFAGADVVIHAAALKQVPSCEYNPFEAVKTNIIGTQNVASAALDAGVGWAVALSTDKSVHPVNLYGATKLCAEKLFVHANAYVGSGKTRLACVRYGNVVGSRGSVVPIFQEQAGSGELTITDERMTRFWITLDQAVDLVLLALERMSGGEVFVPKVPSMRVVDLAQAIAPGAPIRYIGIRPGEKVHEMLITEDESRHAFDCGDCYVVMPEHPHWEMKTPAGAVPLPSDFVYSSETNHEWVDGSDVESMVQYSSSGSKNGAAT